jgi:hypothetical protein
MCYNIVLQMCDKNVQGKHDCVCVCACAHVQDIKYCFLKESWEYTGCGKVASIYQYTAQFKKGS